MISHHRDNYELNNRMECYTLKFNMEPEKKSLEKEIPALETIIFRFQLLNFGGVSRF